jgi:hypothetical protein
MAEFQATTDDLKDYVRRQQLQMVKRQGRYPAGAIIGSAVLVPIYLPVALVAIGMTLAWALSIYWEFRNMGTNIWWRHSWMKDRVVLEVLDDGMRVSSVRGSSMIRWAGGIVVRSIPGYFVLEDEGEDLIVLSKKYLDLQEQTRLISRAQA